MNCSTSLYWTIYKEMFPVTSSKDVPPSPRFVIVGRLSLPTAVARNWMKLPYVRVYSYKVLMWDTSLNPDFRSTLETGPVCVKCTRSALATLAHHRTYSLVHLLSYFICKPSMGLISPSRAAIPMAH